MKQYTTKTGDTIYTLATLFYYRAELWPLLYYTNRSVIGDDPFSVVSGLKLQIPDAPTETQKHLAIDGDTSLSLSKLYYGISYYYRAIDDANDYPPYLSAGTTYTIPALASQLEIDAAKDLRRELNVEFDR